MKKRSRREFIGSSIGLGLVPFVNSPLTRLAAINQSDRKLKILILGGTSFLGPHQIAYALDRGHEVSTFTRGKTIPKINPQYFSQVEQLIGDREDNLEALKNRKWDVVIDNSGRKTKWTKETADLLKDHVELYMYTSSISVYYPYFGDDFTEEREVVTEIPKDAADSEIRTYEYGVMKANSELAAIDAVGAERSVIVRPALIVGPGDRTDRFAYWLSRLEKGGDVMIPGSQNEVVQYIDVRDLAEWMIRLLENKSVGTYNGSGPGFPISTNAFVHGIHANFNSPIQFTQVDDIDFLQENGVIGIQPWVIQLPKYKGMSMSSNSKAIASDLKFRPLSQTVSDTHDWWYSDAVTPERRKNILEGDNSFIHREKILLKKWRERNNKLHKKEYQEK